jgi:hypothetical protein
MMKESHSQGKFSASIYVTMIIITFQTRNFVDATMHEYCMEGFQCRHPEACKVVHVPLTSLGPNDEWSGDGHDKLKKIGMAVYGIRDKASGKWLSLKIMPNNRLNIAVAYLYLCLVEELGGCCIQPLFAVVLTNPSCFIGMPLQSTTDCGSETTTQFAFASLLR